MKVGSGATEEVIKVTVAALIVLARIQLQGLLLSRRVEVVTALAVLAWSICILLRAEASIAAPTVPIVKLLRMAILRTAVVCISTNHITSCVIWTAPVQRLSIVALSWVCSDAIIGAIFNLILLLLDKYAV